MDTPQLEDQQREQAPQPEPQQDQPQQPVQNGMQETIYVAPLPPTPSVWEHNRILLKGLLVGALILLMLIPGMFVSNLVSERRVRQEGVVNEVSSKWAEHQTVIGPVLMLPYKDYVKAADGRDVEVLKMAYILPDELRVNGTMTPTVKKRSLYSVMLYGSKIKLDGSFKKLPIEALKIPPANIMWQDARLAISVGDMRGITEQVALTWNGTQHILEPGVPENNLFSEGVSIPVSVTAETLTNFSIDLSLKGSEYLYFTPVGKSTEVTLSAPWKAPAFDGQYLPDNSSVTAGNFSAHWKILPMSHNFPQYWKDAKQELQKGAFGVRLIQTVDGYSKTDRSVKYALLFIALTFTFFFFLEILLKRQIHAVQYILVGMALIIFYTLLLSISEYTGFNAAYLIAALATVSLIGSYVWTVFKNGKTAIGFIAALAGLYFYIFILIQSEDYALLFGSIGLFLILAVIMYFSRKIEWYAPAKKIIA